MDISKIPSWILSIGILIFSTCFLIALFVLEEKRSFAGLDFGPAGNRDEMPSGAVVAFDRTPSKPCPDGWAVWREATSRVIVGAGNNEDSYESKYKEDENGTPLTPRAYRQHGGAEVHVLTIEQMPTHQHEARRVPWGNLDWKHGGTDPYWDKNGGKYEAYKTGASGKNQAHNIMQPYVALYYCKKN